MGSALEDVDYDNESVSTDFVNVEVAHPNDLVQTFSAEYDSIINNSGVQDVQLLRESIAAQAVNGAITREAIEKIVEDQRQTAPVITDQVKPRTENIRLRDISEEDINNALNRAALNRGIENPEDITNRVATFRAENRRLPKDSELNIIISEQLQVERDVRKEQREKSVKEIELSVGALDQAAQEEFNEYRLKYKLSNGGSDASVSALRAKYQELQERADQEEEARIEDASIDLMSERFDTLNQEVRKNVAARIKQFKIDEGQSPNSGQIAQMIFAAQDSYDRSEVESMLLGISPERRKLIESNPRFRADEPDRVRELINQSETNEPVLHTEMQRKVEEEDAIRVAQVATDTFSNTNDLLTQQMLIEANLASVDSEGELYLHMINPNSANGANYTLEEYKKGRGGQEGINVLLADRFNEEELLRIRNQAKASLKKDVMLEVRDFDGTENTSYLLRKYYVRGAIDWFENNYSSEIFNLLKNDPQVQKDYQVKFDEYVKAKFLESDWESMSQEQKESVFSSAARQSMYVFFDKFENQFILENLDNEMSLYLDRVYEMNSRSLGDLVVSLGNFESYLPPELTLRLNSFMGKPLDEIDIAEIKPELAKALAYKNLKKEYRQTLGNDRKERAKKISNYAKLDMEINPSRTFNELQQRIIKDRGIYRPSLATNVRRIATRIGRFFRR